MTAEKKAPPSRPTQYPGAPLVEIEAMLLRLTELRQHEASKDRRADYGAVIDRLHALAYRLEIDAAPGRTIGLPRTAEGACPCPDRTRFEQRGQAAAGRVAAGPGHRARQKAAAALNVLR